MVDVSSILVCLHIIPMFFLGYRQNYYETKLICVELLYSETNLVVGSEKKAFRSDLLNII